MSEPLQSDADLATLSDDLDQYRYLTWNLHCILRRRSDGSERQLGLTEPQWRTRDYDEAATILHRQLRELVEANSDYDVVSTEFDSSSFRYADPHPTFQILNDMWWENTKRKLRDGSEANG